MARQIAFIFSMLLFLAMASGQAVHYLHCLEVTESGGVTLTWEPAGNQSDFVACHIYHRVPPGNFNVIATITAYGTTSFIHDITSANQQSVQYYIHTEQTTSPGLFSDTLSTIHLTVDNTNNYIAILDWNAMHIPLLGSSEPYYKVMSHNPAGPFSLVDSTLDSHFEMPVLVCRDTLYFRIWIGDENGCLSVSNVSSAIFRDTEPPPMPVLDSVSINPFTGEVMLGWNESPAGDAGGYVVYKVLPTINDTLDKVFGKDITSYIDSSFDPCLNNRSYALASMDTCGNISPGSYDIPQRTILFNEVLFDPCEMVNTLNWTEYINMEPALEGYRIYISVDGGVFEVLAILPSGTTSYMHAGLEASRNYQYFVRAFSVDDLVTSTSCFRELATWQYRQPLENEVANASVVDDEFVSLTLWPDTFAYVPEVILYRADGPSGPWDALETLDLSGEQEVTYDDHTAEVNISSYYYRSSLTDSCGNEVLVTEPLRTILLQGNKAGAQSNDLIWNAFEGWPSGVEKYEVYRAVNETGSFEVIGSTGPATLFYTDDFSSLSAEFSVLRYMVKAVHNGLDGRYSYSNSIIFEYAPDIYMPNAFKPGGMNPVYKPVGAFTQFSEYRMDIYNRWGELLFTSHDFGLGWDGKHRGSMAPAGVYVCLVSYRANTGETSLQKSTFVLLR